MSLSFVFISFNLSASQFVFILSNINLVAYLMSNPLYLFIREYFLNNFIF